MITAFISSCQDKDTSNNLYKAEQLLDTTPAAADSILESMTTPSSKQDRAWYAVLKTQATYKQYKSIYSDSLILTATSYYGSHHKNYRSAMAWYTQGCVYKELNDDIAAIDAYLKAKDLFPDTLVRYYALTEQNLGLHFLNRMMLEQAKYQFLCCKINAERLNDHKILNYVSVREGLCALYERNFELSDSIFSEIISNDSFSKSQKLIATLQKAKICLYYSRDFHKALFYIDSYLESVKQVSDLGVGYSVKADIYYEIKEYDSAYYYSNESMKYDNELYTKCSNADRLTELAVLLDSPKDAVEWYNLYKILRDSINISERSQEIEKIQYAHNEELAQETLKYKQIRFMIIGSFSLLLMATLFFLLYYIFKNRERKKIVEKQQDLLRQEDEIRKSNIKVLQARVSELSVFDQEARSTLLDLYRSRLTVCRNRFSQTESFKILYSFKLGTLSNNLSKEKKETLFEEIELSYMEIISDIVAEIPDVKEKEILTIILRQLDLSINLISELFSITPIAIKQRLSRLSKRAPSDFLNLFTSHTSF